MSETYAQSLRRLALDLAGFLDPHEARAESRRWFEEGLGLSPAWMLAHAEDPMPGPDQERIAQWLERRRAGEPWAYLLGWTWFRGRRFQVTPATLIPRPETELVLEAALDVGRRLGIGRACDIGTGTGILGICLALETGWAVTATDLSPAALAVARANAAALGADLAFLEGDLLAPVPDPLGLVVSNPPYVDPADQPSLQPELAFEPASALFAPDRGLALATAILDQARRRGAPACVLEIGAGQGEALRGRAQAQGWRRVAVHQDFAGHDRILISLG